MYLFSGIVCIKVETAFVQIKGKRHYLGLWGTSKSKERYSRFVAELATNPSSLPLSTALSEQNLTVLELCAAYWEFAPRFPIRRPFKRHGGIFTRQPIPLPFLDRYTVDDPYVFITKQALRVAYNAAVEHDGRPAMTAKPSRTLKPKKIR